MARPVAEPDPRVAQLGSLVAKDLLAITGDDTLLVVVDESGWANNGDIAEAIVKSARESGASALIMHMDDAPVDARGHRVEYLPEAVAAATKEATALVSLSLTTSAPLPHHHTPISLIREGRLRGVFMVKRSREDLLGESVLGVDYAYMSRVADAWQRRFQAGVEVRLTSSAGTDLWASIEGMPSHRSDFAHAPGGLCPINWGEVYQGPVVGSAHGKVVVDGPILGYGWPKTPVVIHVVDGLAVKIEGDPEIAGPLWSLASQARNGTNVAEIALGINPRANGRSPNVFKKGLGRVHVALGNGLVYDQGIDSDIHIDCILPTPNVEVDGKAVIVEGKPADPTLLPTISNESKEV